MGKEVVPFKYDIIHKADKGFAIIEKDIGEREPKQGLIDKSGKEIIHRFMMK